MTSTLLGLPTLLAQGASANPTRLCVREVDGRTLSYGELHEEAARWAALLRNLGVRDGDCVSTMLTNCSHLVAVWAGISGLRACEVPIHTAYRGSMLRHALGNVRAAVVVTHSEFLPRILEVLPDLQDLRYIVVLGEAAGEVWNERCLDGHAAVANVLPLDLEDTSGHHTACAMYTSGTTGPSKAVLMPWAQLAASSLRCLPMADVSERDIFYLHATFAHMGSRMLAYLSIYLRATMVIAPSFKAGRFVEDAANFGCTTSLVVGTAASFLTNYLIERPELDASFPIRNLILAPLPPPQRLTVLAERFGIRVCTAYGMTELPLTFLSDGWVLPTEGSCGRLQSGWPGLQVRLVDENDYEVPSGSSGELVVRSDEPWIITPGYVNMPEATMRAWRNGWFHTGDIFRRDTDGNFYFVDRTKDMIRRRGENISSFEVEAIVASHPDVSECAAIAVPGDLGDDEVKVFVVRRPGASLDAESLWIWLSERMPKFMVPRFIQWGDALPKTDATSKVKKHELRGTTAESVWDSNMRTPARIQSASGN